MPLKTISNAEHVSTLSQLASFIISMDEIIGKLNSFFTDSVILKMNYDIQALGTEVESLTGFTSDELCGQPLALLCADPNVRQLIEKEMSSGYFEEIATSFLDRQNQPVKVHISGFYLGLISDINGYIILKVKILEDNTFLKRELVTKKQELDSFIYRTAHDLRGPIATIKGLVNLMKIRKGDHEVDELTSLIEVHANKLDDRLFKLLYMADENSDAEECNGIVDFPLLKGTLAETLDNNFLIRNTTFDFFAPGESLYYVNERRLTRLLNNVLLYIIGLPLATIPTEGAFIIGIDFEVLTNKLKLRILTRGFLASDEIKTILEQPVSLYNDILNYPFLFNYYVAQREAKQLHGFLHIDFPKTGEQILSLTIPFDYSLAIKKKRSK